MKNKITLLLIAFALIGSVVAITFSSKQNAIDFIQSEKLKVATKWDNLKINFTTDKICEIDFNTEKIMYCQVCYVAWLDEFYQGGCVDLPENNSLEDDEILVRNDAIRELNSTIIYETQDIDYIAREMEGDALSNK